MSNIEELVSELEYAILGAQVTGNLSRVRDAKVALYQAIEFEQLEILRKAVFLVLEGWTIPPGARKLLESAYYCGQKPMDD